jgi:L-fucose mutarotase
MVHRGDVVANGASKYVVIVNQQNSQQRASPASTASFTNAVMPCWSRKGAAATIGPGKPVDCRHRTSFARAALDRCRHRDYSFAQCAGRNNDPACRREGRSVMLKGIAPLLNADILHAMASMGHGDVIAVVDANFPADSIARQSRLGRILRMENVTSAEAVAAVLSVMPLDTFIDDAVTWMEVVGAPDKIQHPAKKRKGAIDRAEGKSRPLLPIKRSALYERAKSAYCVLQTGERRFYGCFLLTKGVIAPEQI